MSRRRFWATWLEPCPEQRVSAVPLGHELLAGDLQVGLAEPCPVDRIGVHEGQVIGCAERR